MKKERKVWAMTLIAFWWLAPNQINAQQQDSLKTFNLNEVVVTATKFPKSQRETGKVLTVIDEEQLSRSSGKDLSQLLNEQVGLVVNGANSNPGKDKSVFLRGAKGDYTLILVDGIPVFDPSGPGGAFDLRLLPVEQVERIEILKGSQSTLYGSDAIAGVINIITKKDGDKPFGGFGTISYGSYNTFRGNAGVSGSTPLLDYNLGYTRFQTDGISEARDEDGAANFDKDGFDQNAVQLNLGIKPSAKFAIRPFIRYSDFAGKYDAGAFSDDPDATYDAVLLNFGLTGEYSFTKGTVNVQYAHDNTDRTFENAFGKYEYEGLFDNAEVFVNYDLTEHFQLLAGINYQHLRMIDKSGPVIDESLNITGPYLSFFARDIKGFSMELGGRLVNHSTYGSTFVYSLNPSYFIRKRVKVFINYSTGFKAPTLYQLSGPFGSNKGLQPEESVNVEAGAQFISVDGRFDVRATVFSRKVENAIVYMSGTYINFNKQDDLGFEIEPSVRINEKLNIRAFYAFVTGELTTRVGERDTTYNNLIRRPGHSVGLNIGYQFTPRLFASVNVKTFGKRDDIFFDLTTFTSRSVELEAYQLVDLYAEYRFLDNKLKVFADAKNLLNQQYYEVYGYNTLRFNVNTGIALNF